MILLLGNSQNKPIAYLQQPLQTSCSRELLGSSVHPGTANLGKRALFSLFVAYEKDTHGGHGAGQGCREPETEAQLGGLLQEVGGA